MLQTSFMTASNLYDCKYFQNTINSTSMPRSLMQRVSLDGNYIALVQPQKWEEYTEKSVIHPHSAHPLKRRCMRSSSFHIYYSYLKNLPGRITLQEQVLILITEISWNVFKYIISLLISFHTFDKGQILIALSYSYQTRHSSFLKLNFLI